MFDRQWRLKSEQEHDLDRVSSWRIDPDPSGSWPCALVDRQPKLAITPRDGSDPVLYSLGPAPSSIWRGDVLMRCGPAFDLRGGIRSGSRYRNRVVLQATDGFVAERDALASQLLVVGQLQLPLQAAQQLLSPAVARRHGFILPRFGRQCICLRPTCL